MTDGAHKTPDRANRNSFSIESYLFLFIQPFPMTVHCPPDLRVQDFVRYIHLLQQQGELTHPSEERKGWHNYTSHGTPS